MDLCIEVDVVRVLEWLHQQGLSDINSEDVCGESTIYIAAKCGFASYIPTLVELGGNVNRCDRPSR